MLPRLSERRTRHVVTVATLIAALIAYRVVYTAGYQRTSALYIGVPAIIALGITLAPPSTSPTSSVMRGMTLALCLSGVLLPEGLACILFAAPLAFIVGGYVALVAAGVRRRGGGQREFSLIAGLPLALLSMEGVVGTTKTEDAAQRSLVVEASAAEVAARLASPPRFDIAVPDFLRVGFNRPLWATGSGLRRGDQRHIEFDGGTHDDHPLRLFDVTGERSVDHHSSMEVTVVDSSPGRVVFFVSHDSTMLARWVTLERAIVTWAAVDGSHTRVTWRFEYRRLLSPSFYFGPLQRYGMGEAAEFLLHATVDRR